MPQMLYKLWALSRASSIKSREPASIIWFFPASLQIRISFSRVCNLLAEYGEKIRTDVAGEAHYQEHYEVIIGADALQKLALI